MAQPKTSIGQKLLHEVKAMLLLTLYFFFGFNLLVVLLVLLASEKETLRQGLTTATLLALVVAKVMLIAEGLLGKHLRRRGGFLAAVIKKATVFSVLVMVALMAEAIIHQLLHGVSGLTAAIQTAWSEGSAERFLARLLYLIVMFSLYAFVGELNQYLAPRGIADVVFSRFMKPRVIQAATLRLGIVGGIEPEHAAERSALVKELYASLSEFARAEGAYVDLFGGARAVVVWPDVSVFEREEAVRLFDRMSKRFLEASPRWAPKLDRELLLKGVVTTGELHIYEVAAEGRREFVTDGPGLERSHVLLEAKADAGLLFDDGAKQNDG